jgi:hypothetical protein
MTTRLFHAIIVCGAALGMVPLACGAEAEAEHGKADEAGAATTDAGAPDGNVENRCRLADGGCAEHCSPLGDGGCLDPCFVHTSSCSPDCLQLDGSCGWPPTK